MQELVSLYRDDYEREEALQKDFDSFIHSRIKEWSKDEIELLARVNVSLAFKALAARSELERWAEAMEKDMEND